MEYFFYGTLAFIGGLLVGVGQFEKLLVSKYKQKAEIEVDGRKYKVVDITEEVK